MSGNQEFKRDAGKTRYDLLPARALEGLARVLTFGATKYAPYSWQQVEFARYIAAAQRHFAAVALDGEELDSESGIEHAWHYLACHLFIAWKMAFRPEEVRSYMAQQDFAAPKQTTEDATLVIDFGEEVPALSVTPSRTYRESFEDVARRTYAGRLTGEVEVDVYGYERCDIDGCVPCEEMAAELVERGE